MAIMRPRGAESRLPIHGKIKAGVKGGTQGRKAIKTWRFHSPDRIAIDQIQARYGGNIVAMNDPKANPPSQWEVITPVNLVRVWLPANALRVAEYELRDQGQLRRRCDGETCMSFQKNGPWDGVGVDCICNRNNRRECQATVVLDTILPDVYPFRGVWRFITHSWYALDEIPAMEELIHQMQTMGIAEAGLILNERSQTGEVNGKMTKKNFVVAGLQTWGEHTLEQLLAGEGRVALGTGSVSTKALTMGDTADPPEDDDDQIIDAELVEEDDLLISMCDAMQHNQQLPFGGLELLLVIGRSLFPPGAQKELTDFNDAQWKRLGEAIRGINDGTVIIRFTPQGVKLTKAAQ